VAGAIVVLAAVAYGNSLQGRFVWDDRMLILKDPVVRSLHRLGEAFRSDFFARSGSPMPYGYYRPVTTLSYTLDRAVWGLEPLGFHLTNIALHALASVLGFLVLLELGLSLRQAAAGAALFAVHPIHAENVAWIAGRTDVLAFVLGAGSLLVYLRARSPAAKPATESRPRKRHDAAPAQELPPAHFILRMLSLVLFGLTLLAKEIAVVIPAWIFLIHLLGRREGWRRSLRAVVPYGAVLTVYLGVRFLVIHVPPPEQQAGAGIVPALLTAPATTLRYLGWLASPDSPAAYVQNAYVRSVKDPRFWAVLAGLAVVVAVLGRLARKDRRIGLFAAMFAVSLVPILNLVRVASPMDMGDTMAARFCYLPSLPFLALAIVLLTGSKWLPSLAGVLLMAGLVAAGLANTWRTSRDWHDNESLFSRIVEQVPDAPLPWVELGFAHLRHGRLEEARRAFSRAAVLAPGSWLTLNARANLLAVEGRVQEALPLQRRLASMSGKARPVQLANLAYLERVNGHLDRAQSILEKLVASGHATSNVWFNLAEVHRVRGENDAAEAAYARALAGDPSNVAKLLRVGSFEQQRGDYASARSFYERVLEKQPGNPQAQLYLADVLVHEGRRQDAIAYLRALRSGASDPRLLKAVNRRLDNLQQGSHGGRLLRPEVRSP